MTGSRPTPRRRWRAARRSDAPGRPRRAATLVLGMGNPLMGDDGVGWALARGLARHPALPEDVYVTWGGTDLLATCSLLDGRTRVVILDVVVGEVPGRLVRVDPWATHGELDDPCAGGRPVPGALRLLRMVSPDLAEVDVRLVCITVAPVRPGADLSPALAARLPQLAEAVLDELT